MNTTIAGELLGLDAREQGIVDMLMLEADGTPNKSNFGANATLAVSLATAQAARCSTCRWALRWRCSVQWRPVPMFNILNGGKHADNTVDFKSSWCNHGALIRSKKVSAAAEIYHHLKKVLKGPGFPSRGDEGGFAPNPAQSGRRFGTDRKPPSNKNLGEQVFIALDPATSEMVGEAKNRARGHCFFKSDPSRVASTDEMIDLWAGWCGVGHGRSIEDGLIKRLGRLEKAHRTSR